MSYDFAFTTIHGIEKVAAFYFGMKYTRLHVNPVEKCPNCSLK